jgi:excisionase family DNA binding protein
MKRYVKTSLDTLEALGCHLDHKDRETRTDRWRFTHPNAPDEFFTLSLHSSETAVRAVVQRARVAAGLATSESGEKRRPKVNQRQKMERAAERDRKEAARAAADARAAEREAQVLVAQRSRQVRQLDRIMRGPAASGTSNARPEEIPANSMLTVEEIADRTGLTDKAVRRAVESGKLEAYQCGKEVRSKGSDVRTWLEAAS